MELPLIFSNEEKDEERWLCVKTGDKNLTDPQSVFLFGEISEALLSSGYRNLCLDLSHVSIVTSRLFGMCFNIINKAEERGKKVKFRFNKDAMETATLVNFPQRATVEVV